MNSCFNFCLFLNIFDFQRSKLLHFDAYHFKEENEQYVIITFGSYYKITLPINFLIQIFFLTNVHVPRPSLYIKRYLLTPVLF